MVFPWTAVDREISEVENEKEDFRVQVTLAVLPHMGLLFGLPPV